VRKAFDAGLPFTVDAFIPTSTRLPKEFFRPLLHKFVEVSHGDESIYKELFNRLSGCLGKDNMQRAHAFVDSSSDIYWRHVKKHVALGDLESGPRQELVNGYYLYHFTATTPLAEVNTTIYLQILDNQSMRVFDMERAIGGVPSLRKSDCSVLVRPTNIRALGPAMIPDPKAAPKVKHVIRTWGLWCHQGDMPKLTCHVSDSDVPLPEPMEWTTHSHICDSNQWEEALDIVQKHGRVLIEGGPGMGKTWMALKIGEALRRQGLSVEDISYTNMAALNIGGRTMDRALGLRRSEANSDEDPDPTHYGLKWIKAFATRTDVLLVDEVSLPPAHYWWVIDSLLDYKPSIKVILVGDRNQCSPVEPGASSGWSHYFDHSLMKAVAGCNRIELTVRHRSKDPKLDHALDWLKDGGAWAPTQPGVHRRNLMWTRACRDRVNRMLNIDLKPDSAMHLPANEHGDEMWVHPGLPLQSIKTLKKDCYSGTCEDVPFLARNERFDVSRVDQESLTLVGKRKDRQADGITFMERQREITVPIGELQENFRLGYACTVHSCQGDTIKEPFTIWEWDRMSRQLRYTAVGRAEMMHQVHVPPTGQYDHTMRDDTYQQELRTIEHKISNYRRQDLRRNQVHSPEEYPDPQQVLQSLRDSEYCCARCQRTTQLKDGGGAMQWTLQRVDNTIGHVKSNVINYCLACNRERPETNFVAPEYE
jgi:hypothetical protein